MLRAWILTVAALGAGFLASPFCAEQTGSTEAERRREDIAVFRQTFLSVDRSFAAAARKEAERRLAALGERAGRISQAYFELELSRIVALADNGHTVAFAGPRSRRFNRIPAVRFAPFGEEFHVLRAAPDHADLLGARLATVDGVTVAKVREVARSLAGGPPSWRDRSAAYFFESPEQMHALDVIAREDGAEYGFELADGTVVRRRFEAEPANPDRVRANSNRWLYPQLMEEEGEEWHALLAVDEAPWALQDLDVRFRTRDAPEIDSFVIELRQNVSSEKIDISKFTKQSLGLAKASGRRNIVLDLRMNGGGDLNNTRAWSRRLSKAVTGRVFVLTSPWTFSAAISTVGYLKQEAPERVIIVGEHVGDRLDFHAEGSVTVLPHSGVAVLSATERHDYRTGCRNIENCHGSVKRHPIAVDSLAPDIDAPWTIEAYREGRDPAIEAVAEAVAGSR